MTDNLAQVIKDLNIFVDDSIKKLSLDIVAILVSPSPAGTPVDTGWARSNWIPSLGTPVTSPHGSKLSVSGSAQQAGTAKLLTYTRAKGTIFISNSVPYIGRLNAGSSTKSPSGFVQKAIIRAISELSK